MSSLLFSGIWRFKQPKGHSTSFDNIEITHGVSLKGDFGQISELTSMVKGDFLHDKCVPHSGGNSFKQHLDKQFTQISLEQLNTDLMLKKTTTIH